MRFYRTDECQEWLTGRQRQKPNKQSGLLIHQISYPREGHRFYGIADWVSSNLTFGAPVLLWITGWGIFPSSENLHLYYRLRQSYGDYRLLDEAPGHFFLQYEMHDLTSFLQLSMLNGWDGYVLGHNDAASVFFSHDECVDFYSAHQSLLDDIKKALG